ncbi:DUF294 nucleotidyltransferase-like domain-containing protein [Bacillus daqingensis]|uniref:DUF294 nucleotidyltransferase-like domain-containing protein n=1 Tax=Bacillus daqingensis TaxID=872396 RepID=A0ABV9NTH5_9BACI
MEQITASNNPFLQGISLQDPSVSWEEVNVWHDRRIEQLFKEQLCLFEDDHGPLPSPCSFYVMGSAGRGEQAAFSDQDHGILYEGKNDSDAFLKLGERVAEALYHAGYPYCEGKVMSSNPLWCKNLPSMEAQLSTWLDQPDWEAVRYLMIFMDARTLSGSAHAEKMKQIITDSVRFRPELMDRIIDNTSFRQKRRNMFGQVITDSKGNINYKESILFPFVHAARIGAVFEKVNEQHTPARLRALPPALNGEAAARVFEEALSFRQQHVAQEDSYETIHLLNMKSLKNEEKEKVKQFMKEGKRLYRNVTAYYRKRDNG